MTNLINELQSLQLEALRMGYFSFHLDAIKCEDQYIFHVHIAKYDDDDEPSYSGFINPENAEKEIVNIKEALR